MALGLYIHVPFCLAKCRYCDFISYPYVEAAAAYYFRTLGKELELYGSVLAEPEKKLDSVFIGGGTPTSTPAIMLQELLAKVKKQFHLLPECEITVEANPGTVNRHYLEHLRESGVNRLSLGVQSFQDSLLALLGRIHTAAAAVEAVHAAKAAGFTNLNLDLIFGIPGQTTEDWLASLKQAINLEPAHVATYGLQLEQGTPLAQAVSGGELAPCPEDQELYMYQTAIDYLNKQGYEHYEISNFARPGRESSHNLKYWLNQPYLGVGPAAYSYLHGERYANDPDIGAYAVSLNQGKLPIKERETTTSRQEMAETLFMGLRLLKGVDLETFYRRFGRRAEDIYRGEIAFLQKTGLVEIAAGCLRLTAKGLPLGNEVFMEFVDEPE